MHCVLTADLASLLSQHGPSIIRGQRVFATSAVATYWATSRTRFELWHQTLARYRRAEESGNFQALRDWWRDHSIVMEEVLVTEILTRVVAGLVAAVESQTGDFEVGPVTHAVYLSHIEARNRVQKIMLYSKGNSVEDAVRLNRLRQAVERWTDAMIGRMATETPKNLQYAFDLPRAAHYCEDMRQMTRMSSRSTAMWLMNASMHDTLRRRTSERSALPEANREVVQSVLRMLRPTLFDSLGTLKSKWLHQLESGPESDRAPAPHIDSLAETLPTSEPPQQGSDQPHFERWYQ